MGLPQERTSTNGCSSRTGGEPDQLLIPLLFTSLPCHLGCHFILSDSVTLTPGRGQGKKEVMGDGGRKGRRKEEGKKGGCSSMGLGLHNHVSYVSYLI